jgi:hypothetical protein
MLAAAAAAGQPGPARPLPDPAHVLRSLNHMTVVANPAVPLACEAAPMPECTCRRDVCSCAAASSHAALVAGPTYECALGVWHLSVAPPAPGLRWASAAVAAAAQAAAAGFEGPDARSLVVGNANSLFQGLLGMTTASGQPAQAPPLPSAQQARATEQRARQAAAACAARALKQSGGRCADAWNLRALRCAGSLEEALELYRRGEACAADALAPDARAEWEAWSAADAARGVWAAMPEMQPWVRSAHGVANTLRKLGRWAEARAAYALLEARGVANAPAGSAARLR